MTKKLETRLVALCDDVRMELGNRASLIGVISGNILVQQFPINIRLASYIEVVPLEHDDTLEIELTWDGLKKPKTAAVLVECVDNDGATTAIIILTEPDSVKIEGPCSIKLKARWRGVKRWKTLRSIDVLDAD